MMLASRSVSTRATTRTTASVRSDGTRAPARPQHPPAQVRAKRAWLAGLATTIGLGLGADGTLLTRLGGSQALAATEKDHTKPYTAVLPLVEVATFAGGCFWCMEPPFDKLDGVMMTTSGYSGGREAAPTYQTVSAGITGHAEALQVLYDPSKVTYEQLLDTFWHQINPTQTDQQFCDRGKQYRSAIFYHNESQRRAAEASKVKYAASGVFGTGFLGGPRQLVTEVTAVSDFWPAEEYHQDYYLKNPARYAYYRNACGRDKYLSQVWGADAVDDHAVPSGGDPPPFGAK